MKVFISQGMKGKTAEQIKTERQELIKSLNERIKDVEIIDSFIPDGNKKDPVYCLGISIQKLSEADIVVFAQDWYRFRGCKIEMTIAVEYEKRVLVL